MFLAALADETLSVLCFSRSADPSIREDGRWLSLQNRDQTEFALVNVETGKLVTSLPKPFRPTPDGKTAVVRDLRERNLILKDLAEGRDRAALVGQDEVTGGLSPDSRWLLTRTLAFALLATTAVGHAMLLAASDGVVAPGSQWMFLMAVLTGTGVLVGGLAARSDTSAREP